MVFNTDGLILTEQSVGESDKLVTVLCEQYGIIRAFVKGAKNIKNKNSSATQTLCFSQMSIFKGRDKYIINEAESQETFCNLRNNIEKLSLAQYFCELAMVLAPQEENAEQHLKLILNALYFLNEGTRNSVLLKGIVELRMLSLSGYMPDIICCKKCGEYESDIMYYHPFENTLYCSKCNINSKNNDKYFILTRNVMYALRYTLYTDINKLFSFNLLNPTLSEYCRVCEEYLLSTVERDFKTLRFYKEICTYNQ